MGYGYWDIVQDGGKVVMANKIIISEFGVGGDWMDAAEAQL
jgi:hypothetical protein